MKLSPSDAERLTKLLGLLNSEHAGERANAGAAADKFLRDRGLRWNDVVAPASSPPPREASVLGKIDYCLAHSECLSEWEIDFCRTCRRLRRLSLKQAIVLDKIALEVRAYVDGCQ